ncbi:hypothetical protein [Actinomadura physcomitrii]|uniref:hypothetical protein n=1 Tax=Actinomadura physcomitrii TaxID=2650748 RepID=UPI001922D235|nr:hypothetical protein [Actinomadura physcomitrii]
MSLTMARSGTQTAIADVGVAIFQVGITLTLFQVLLLNQIAEDRFVEHARSVPDEQQEDVKLAVAQSMAESEKVETLRLSPKELDHVIETASRLRSGNLLRGVLPVRLLHDQRAQDAFRLPCRQMEGRVRRGVEGAGHGRGLAAPLTGEFDDWSNGFTFIDATFGGQPVSFSAKVLANGNLLSFEVPKPTFGATYSISVAVPGIERIRALDYFGAPRPASISYAPGARPDAGHQRQRGRLDPAQGGHSGDLAAPTARGLTTPQTAVAARTEPMGDSCRLPENCKPTR